jgi:hypothetical protein
MDQLYSLTLRLGVANNECIPSESRKLLDENITSRLQTLKEDIFSTHDSLLFLSGENRHQITTWWCLKPMPFTFNGINTSTLPHFIPVVGSSIYRYPPLPIHNSLEMLPNLRDVCIPCCVLPYLAPRPVADLIVIRDRNVPLTDRKIVEGVRSLGRTLRSLTICAFNSMRWKNAEYIAKIVDAAPLLERVCLTSESRCDVRITHVRLNCYMID